MTLRLLHWNIHSWIDPATGGSNRDAVIELVRRHRPDAVSLVEVDETWAQPSTLAQVAEATGYTPVFTPAFEYGDDQPAGSFGNAILTRLPIRAVSHRQLTWPDSTYDRTEPSEPRTLLLVALETEDHGNVHVGSTHLPRANAGARRDALLRLRAIAEGLDRTWVICGDFNTTADTWTRPFTTAPTASPTAPAVGPTAAIDYVIAGPNLALDAEVLDATGSDHRAVLVHAGQGLNRPGPSGTVR